MIFFNKIKPLVFFFIFICNINFAFCQEYKIDLSTYNGNNDYWWLVHNNEGRYIHNNNLNFDFIDKRSKFEYKINLSNSFSQTEKLALGESFIKYNFNNNLFLRTGKYYRDFSVYLNDELSSGSMLVSKNAQPLKKIGLVGNYRLKKKDNFNFNWGISHGVFKKNKYYSDAPYLHEKFFYLNINQSNRNYFNIGLVHEAIWAGTTTMLGSLNNPGNQPDSFKDFLKVFISADGPLIPGEPHANALGSHIGIWDFNFLRKNMDKMIKVYYQHYFEDTSSFRFANKTDGLWGVELKNYFPKTELLVEYVNTSNCCIDPPYQDDDYYSNYQYRDGWRYNNNIIGNPFINYYKSRDKIKLFHVGFKTNKEKIALKMKASRITSRNDLIKFQASLIRKFEQTDCYLFIVGNEENQSFGFGLSHKIAEK